MTSPAPLTTHVTSHTQYVTDGMDESELEPTPMAMFSKWFHQALDAGVAEPEAMTLSTVALPAAPAPASASSPVDKRAWRVDAPRPSARIVLLKHADQHGFQFFSNYASRKGEELDANPWCSLTFFWASVHRSVRVCGRVERVSKEESEAYYHSRPKGSQLGAWASPQSEAIASRDVLTARVAAVEKEYGAADPIPLPPHWGGYRVIPDEVEFWTGRTSRLHDRLRYVRDPHTASALSEPASWTMERLAP